MQEVLRHYGKYIIAITSFMLIMGILVTSSIFPQYGLLSFLGKKSQLEADLIDGDYMISTDISGNDVALFENQDIDFEFMVAPLINIEYHINYNKGKTIWPEKCLFKTNIENVDLKILEVKNNNGQDAFATLATDLDGNLTNKYQAVCNSYDYTDATDSKNSYINDDGTLVFNEPGIYSIKLSAKWNNSSEAGYSEQIKTFKIHVNKENNTI